MIILLINIKFDKLKSLMKLLLLFVFIQFLCFSQKTIRTYYDYKNTKPDEVYTVNSRGQNHGLYTKYDEDGAKAVEVNFVNGLKNGAGKEYYRNNGSEKIKITGNYLEDKKHGLFTTYTYVKYDQSYYDIMYGPYFFNEKSDEIFRTGLKVKYREEYYEKGEILKEYQYHKSGKLYYSCIIGKPNIQFICYNEQNVLMAKGEFNNPNGYMIGEWIIPRKENGEAPSRNDLSYGEPNSSSNKYNKVVYVQHLKFNSTGKIDENYMTKSYYLSGRVRDSVKIKSIDYGGGLYQDGVNYCGSKFKMFGPYRAYYENGKIKEEGEYGLIKGEYEKIGLWKTYNTDGKVTLTDYDSLYITRENTLKNREKLYQIYNLTFNAFDTLFNVNNGTGIYVAGKSLSAYSTYNETISINENDDYVTYYIKFKKPSLFKAFIEIRNELLDISTYEESNISKIYSLDDDDFINFYNKNNDKYLSSLNNIEKCKSLTDKMLEIKDLNTKSLEKALNTDISLNEKITLIMNFIEQ